MSARNSNRPFFGAALVLIFAGPAPAAEPKLTFNRDIRPILSDRCFMCHGPDEKKRQGELRLDVHGGAVAVREGRAAVVPGKPEAGSLLDRVLSTDPDVQMPPPDSKKPRLTKEEINKLKIWIAQGASYELHWSFMPIARPKPPEVSPANQARVRNPIDRFVLAGVEKAGLGGFSPLASKERLLRRATFDLTGLPPTISEIDAFLSDDSPNAYEKVVDRLLQSPRYGERMAADWLDAARFADTHGYQMDRFRATWPYRDWVIRSFNKNQRFDEFARWQLAGDLLPGPTKDQRLATAFNRLHCQNEEGGVVEEEFRVAYVVDRVTTFGTTFLGLTLECSRCHDHKYDPVSMKEFYSLFAFFQNIPEAGQTTYWTAAMPTPTLLLTTDAQDEEIAKRRADVAAQEKALQERQGGADAAFSKWLRNRPKEPNLPDQTARFDFEDLYRKLLANTVDNTKPGKPVEDVALVDGPTGKAAILSGDNGFTFPGLAMFRRSDPFTIAVRIRPATVAPRMVVLHRSKAPADAGSRGFDLLLESGKVAFGLYHMWPGNAAKIRTTGTIPAEKWSQVVISHDGSGRAAGMSIYIDGRRAKCETIVDRLAKDLIYEDGEPDLAVGYRFRDVGFKGGMVDDLQIFARELSPVEAAHISGKQVLQAALAAPEADLTFDQRTTLRAYFVSAFDAPSREAAANLRGTRDELWRMIHAIPESMVMDELPSPKPAYVLNRGSYDQPTERVTADTPRSLPPMRSDLPRNRLGLADWLLDPEHPLFARVTVNRFWQMFFGRGLVETADNFGSQGSPPTHPELLDWLARDFMETGWDVRRLVKLIVLSETYQQDSKGSPDALQKDPDNRWLARAPVRRLRAEMLRDQALFASGLLVEKIGGPSVKPYQPDGLWNIAMGNPRYDQGKGADLYRRSLYTFWKRTVPPPPMVIFDAADRSYCTVKRQTTSTPLQALVLLNDPQHVEAARKAAERMLREGGSTDESRAQWLWRNVASRKARPAESAQLVAILREQREIFQGDPKAAQKLLKVGESPSDASISTIELAAGTVLAQAVFNHDEAVHQR